MRLYIPKRFGIDIVGVATFDWSRQDYAEIYPIIV